MNKNFNDVYKSEVKWSQKTFGPEYRYKGILDHIRKECVEIEKQPHDLEEWIDMMFLSFDGAVRCVKDQYPKITAEAIVGVILSAYQAKLKKNKKRNWPDWRTVNHEKAIEHIR